jgi:hypothetical protein
MRPQIGHTGSAYEKQGKVEVDRGASVRWSVLDPVGLSAVWASVVTEASDTGKVPGMWWGGGWGGKCGEIVKMGEKNA